MIDDKLSLNVKIENLICWNLDKNSISEALAKLRSLKTQLLERDKAFKLDNLAYGGLLIEIIDAIESCRMEDLKLLQTELKGEESYIISYVFFDDLRDLLNESSLTQYSLLQELVFNYERLVSSLNFSDHDFNQRDYEDKLDCLHNLTYKGPPPGNLPEFIANLGSHILLSLPHYPPKHSFNIQGDEASFSTIFPVDRFEDTFVQLNYINKLLTKIEGKESIYVDIQIVPSGYTINLR